VGHGAKEIDEVRPVVAVPRHLQAPELLGGADLDEVPEPLALLSLPGGADPVAGNEADGFSDAAGSDAADAAGDRTLDRAVCHAHRQGIQRAPRDRFVTLFTQCSHF